MTKSDYKTCPGCGGPLYEGGGFDGKLEFCNSGSTPQCPGGGGKPLPPDMLAQHQRAVTTAGRARRRAFKGIR